MSDPYVILKRAHYTPQQLGDMLGRSRQTIVKWLEQGRIKGWRTPGGHWRIPADSIKGVDHRERIGA